MCMILSHFDGLPEILNLGFPGVDTQTVNFTLRSTLHNIDFGLVVNGVTFYDCSVRDK